MMMLDWSRRAACQAMDPELFFPITMEGPGREQVEQAKSVCRGCPVRQPCLDYAIDTRQVNGVWGGTDPDQRRSLIPMVVRRPETVPARLLPGDR
ncbi:WhiB family transcriptional regulator [Nonomuraea sp. 3-1Str]|uniref:WhiB family transcriptional regulator n=1 Tax=unclassified Nonomuraea TaxID=2593643 RepID=UPI002858DE52|nr:WhiB family transcriptional regulator [Nonomuraea sp. 3-1Str]MDR8409315.1 WhiB family transcriptional regulator [Nonomuraea sp. 3-1Str]